MLFLITRNPFIHCTMHLENSYSITRTTDISQLMQVLKMA